MKRVRLIPLASMVLFAFFLGAATPSDQVPPAFKGLVPAGFKLVSPGFTRNISGDGEMKITMINVNFVASRRFKAKHTDFDGAFKFNLDEMVYPEVLIQMQGKYYKMGLEKDIESARQSYADEKSDYTIGYDAPKETKYQWGWGITQRVHHKYMGAGFAPDDISFRGEYLGALVGDTTIKKFNLLVYGAKSAEEADQWANACAEKIEKTAPGEIQ